MGEGNSVRQVSLRRRNGTEKGGGGIASCQATLSDAFILWAQSSEPGSESPGRIKQLRGCGK